MKLHILDKHTATTTVGDLVAELSKQDQDAFVFTEGCDCIGNVVKVSVDSEGHVLLERDDYACRDGVLSDDYAEPTDETSSGDSAARPFEAIVRLNYCRCHPETCGCDDWAVYVGNEKHSTHFHKHVAELVAKALNAGL